MRLQVIKSKNAASLYIVKSVYENKKHSSKVVEKPGTLAELTEKLQGEDPIEWGAKICSRVNTQRKRIQEKNIA